MSKKLVLVAAVLLLPIFAFVVMRKEPISSVVQRNQRQLNAAEQKVVEIARAAVIANETHRSHLDATFDPKPYKAGWIVGVSFYPLMPGSDRIVVIDADDKVVEYIRGL